ncbi:hypothetical protein OKC48_21020 [Methylorubrum extorquens]|uniref:hypothetical protein n=1 Tax=Methylorubrum extorquens TaxID=408 RepID=UPI002237EF85|nr:hypothetical protein [Methylorubrum extorquens]UYW25730.1 hypothetical protein OKC48_21020 [Methylorubrum extorquens]
MTPAITPELRERAGKDRPIIFSASMVRALIEGRKSQTRRLIRDAVPEAPGMDHVHPKNQIRHAAPYLDAYCGQPRTPANPRGMGEWWCWWTRDDRAGPQFKVGFKPGDRLWVREAWCHTGTGVWSVGDVDLAHDGKLIYRADDDGRDPGIKWLSPLFLSRRRSRLTLEVTEVRVERLQDISEEDAIAEGFGQYASSTPLRREFHPEWKGSYRHGFLALWDRLHSPESTDANPWVAAISFRVILANIDAPPATPLATGEAANPSQPTRLSASGAHHHGGR